MHLVVKMDRVLGDYAARLEGLAGGQGRLVLAASLNETMAEVRHKTVAAETAQTGLTDATIDRAQKASEASAGDLTFTIRSEGGDVRLKFFGAHETAGGVEAHPFNQDRVFAHTFMKGGRFPNRVAIAKLNGAVIERQGSSRKPTRTVKSGVVIPTEMTKGRTASAFNTGVETIVATTIVRKLGALLP